MHTEEEFRQSPVICFVLVASTPLKVMEGFLNHIREMTGLQGDVSELDGVFIVRFHSVLERDEIIVYFDHKPMIVKVWNVDQSFDKNEISTFPIWV